MRRSSVGALDKTEYTFYACAAQEHLFQRTPSRKRPDERSARHQLRRADASAIGRSLRRTLSQPAAADRRGSRWSARTIWRSRRSPSLASDAGVQPSTMIRFANALGFGGFSAMQQVFRVAPGRALRVRIASASRSMRRRRRSTAATRPDGVLQQFVSRVDRRARAPARRRVAPAHVQRGGAPARAARGASTCSRSGGRSRSRATSRTR